MPCNVLALPLAPFKHCDRLRGPTQNLFLFVPVYTDNRAPWHAFADPVVIQKLEHKPTH